MSKSRSMQPLPPPHQGSFPLDQAMAARRSVRDLGGPALTHAELGQLAWAAQGQRGPYRTVPSAGALYPLELDLVTREGVARYEPGPHRLRTRLDRDARPALYRAALRQEPVLRAPAVVVLVAVFARTASKYGAEHGQRYVYLEAGHAAQNLLLEAVALGLAGVPIGAFREEQAQTALGLDRDQVPVYLVALGRAASSGILYKYQMDMGYCALVWGVLACRQC